MHPEVQSDKSSKCPKCGMDLVEKDKKENHMEHAAKPGMLYTCPMDPDVIQDEPGNCPKCGSELKLLTQPDESGVPPDPVIGARCPACDWEWSYFDKPHRQSILRRLNDIVKELEDLGLQN